MIRWLMRRPRIAIYARSARPDAAWIEQQCRAVRNAISLLHGDRWRWAGDYTDDGVSGEHLWRPGMTELLAELDRGRIDYIAVQSLDRLARNSIAFITLCEILNRRGVRLILVRENQEAAVSLPEELLMSFAVLVR